jgi:hypothetical protein
METDENRKENQERVEWGEKRRGVVYFFQYTRHGKRWGIKRSVTEKIMSTQTACRVP